MKSDLRRRLIGLVPGLLLALPAAAQTPLTLEDLSLIKQVTDVAVSPNGEQIAYLRSQPRELYQEKDGKSYIELYLADDDGNSRPFISGKVSLSKIRWSNDGDMIYFLTKRGEDKHTAIYAIPNDGGEARKVYNHDHNVSHFDLARQGNRMLFLAREKEPKSKKPLKEKGFKAEIYEEDIHASKLWLVDQSLPPKERKATRLDIEGHILAAEFGPEASKLLVKRSPTPLIDDIYMKPILEMRDLEGKLLVQVAHQGKLDKVDLSPDGKYIAYIGAADIHDPAAGRLFLANAETGEVKELLPDYPGHVSDLAWVEDDTLLIIGDLGVETELATVTVKGRKRVMRKPGNGVFFKLSANLDGDVALIGESPQHPREVYFSSRTGKSPKRLSNSNPWLADRKLGKQEVVSYKARDGQALQGLLVYPLDYQQGKRYPAIQFVHGGPEAHYRNGWNNRYSTPAQVAAGQGYVSFYPNYRGSTGLGVEFSKMGQGDYAGAEFDDIVDANKHLINMGLVDGTRIGITGGSYGGYASAWGATAQSEHFAASVMFVGISDKISKFGTTDIPNEMYLVHARSWPWEKWQWLLERSPIYHAQNHKTPLLIMHGKNDTRVHPSQSMELYRYLKTLDQAPVRLVLYPGEGHGNRNNAAQYDYSLRLMRWMDFYLKQDGEGMPPYELPHADKLEPETSKKTEDN